MSFGCRESDWNTIRLQGSVPLVNGLNLRKDAGNVRVWIRLEEKMFSSMEACGILVSEACTLAGLKYYYGPRTLTYSSCVLYNES